PVDRLPRCAGSTCHQKRLPRAPADRAMRQPGQDRQSPWLIPCIHVPPKNAIEAQMFLASKAFYPLSCGILATAIKPDANGPPCSLKPECSAEPLPRVRGQDRPLGGTHARSQE